MPLVCYPPYPNALFETCILTVSLYFAYSLPVWVAYPSVDSSSLCDASSHRQILNLDATKSVCSRHVDHHVVSMLCCWCSQLLTAKSCICRFNIADTMALLVMSKQIMQWADKNYFAGDGLVQLYTHICRTQKALHRIAVLYGGLYASKNTAVQCWLRRHKLLKVTESLCGDSVISLCLSVSFLF